MELISSGVILVAALIGLIGTALSAATGVLEKTLLDEYTSLELMLITGIYGVLVMFPLGLWQAITSTVTADPIHWGALAFSGVIFPLWGLSYLKALEDIQLSTHAPIVEMTPLIVVFLEPLLLQKAFNPLYVFSALLAVSGSSLVLSGDRLIPELSVLKQKGTFFAFLSPVFGAFSSVSTNFATQQIPNLIFVLLWYIIGTLVTSAIAYRQTDFIPSRDIFRKRVLKLAFTNTGSSYIRITMLSLVSASFVTIYWQLSILFSVLLGHQLFQDENVGKKLLGGLLISTGIVLTVIF